MMAIGIGCRKNCSTQDIESLVATALQQLHVVSTSGAYKIASIAEKQHETGLLTAAKNLGVSLVFFPREILHEMNARVLTVSQKSLDIFGVASIAEASALAGAGPEAILLLPRIANARAACAVAGKATL